MSELAYLLGLRLDGRRVVVTAGPDRALTVKVTAATAGAEKELIDKVLAVPEMAGPAVKLEVVVPEVGAAKGAKPKPE